VKTAGLTTIVAALLIAVWIASPALASDCDANGINDAIELGHVNLPQDPPTNAAALRAETAAGFGLTEFTVELWFRNSGSGQRSLFSYNGQFSDNELTILDVNGLDIAVGGVFSFSTFDAEATGNVGDWNHLSIAWRSSDGFTSIRVNGVEVATRTINPGDSVAAGGRLYLGQEQDAGAVDPDPLLDPNQAFFGDLRQVRVWNIFRSTGDCGGRLHAAADGHGARPRVVLAAGRRRGHDRDRSRGRQRPRSHRAGRLGGQRREQRWPARHVHHH
jgi:hypothetical protein